MLLKQNIVNLVSVMTEVKMLVVPKRMHKWQMAT